MQMKRCDTGHYYDAQRHTLCPYCGVPDLKIGLTRLQPPAKPRPLGMEGKDPAEGRRRGGMGVNEEEAGGVAHAGGAEAVGSEEGLTVGPLEKRVGIKPVVGWLICLSGPDRGRDYRFSGGKNAIGRHQSNAICISGDNAVSRVNHASICYDHANNQYHLVPGTGTELVYYNGQPAFTPTLLKVLDRIIVGETELLFVPLCSEGFRWEQPQEG